MCVHVRTCLHTHTLYCRVACLVFVIAVQGAWLLSLLWRGVCVCTCVRSCTHTCLTAESHALVFVIAVQGVWLLSHLWSGVCVCVRVLVQGHMPGICLRSSGSSGWQFCGVACMPTQEVGFMVPPPPAQRTSWSWSLW